MSNRLEQLKSKVAELYEKRDPNREGWADWLYENHIFVVAKNAERLSKKYGADSELTVAASLLHDVADAVMTREDLRHEKKSEEMAEDLLRGCGFSEEEINIAVHDAIKNHGCKNGCFPKTLEGKVMATADALAHLQTGFYDHALVFLQKNDSIADICDWALPKIERDYRDKIFFDEIKDEAAADYKRARCLFSR